MTRANLGSVTCCGTAPLMTFIAVTEPYLHEQLLLQEHQLGHRQKAQTAECRDLRIRLVP